jgi:hypothetical protein
MPTLRRKLRSLLRRLLLGPAIGWAALACSGGPRLVTQDGAVTVESRLALSRAVAEWNHASTALVGYPVFELGEGDVVVHVDTASVRLRCGETADQAAGCAELWGDDVWIKEGKDAPVWMHELGHILGIEDREFPEGDHGVMTWWPDRDWNTQDHQDLMGVLSGR